MIQDNRADLPRRFQVSKFRLNYVVLLLQINPTDSISQNENIILKNLFQEHEKAVIVSFELTIVRLNYRRCKAVRYLVSGYGHRSGPQPPPSCFNSSADFSSQAIAAHRMAV